MTAERLYALADAMLCGADTLPVDDDQGRIALLEASLELTVHNSEPAILTFPLEEYKGGTLDDRRLIKTYAIQLMDEDNGQNYLSDEIFVCVAPRLPEQDNEQLDIDHGLCFAVAKFMASLASSNIDDVNRHKKEAVEFCERYNTETLKGLSFKTREQIRQDAIRGGLSG